MARPGRGTRADEIGIQKTGRGHGAPPAFFWAFGENASFLPRGSLAIIASRKPEIDE